MKPTITLVAFDLGNVLCTVDEEPASKQLAELCDKLWEEVHEIVFGQDEKQKFERGVVTFDEHAVQAIAALGIDMPLDYFTRIYDTVLIPSDNMFPLIARIAENHRIALVSNTSEPHWKSAERFLPFSSNLEPVIVSYEVKSMKPEPAFYDSLLTESNVAKEEILFIDDLAVNIEAAQDSGMIGHHFTSQIALEKALVELGVI
ncbi:MAG: HAD family phosphatase [Chloroflexi bacterium]|nr:HAD family phosphatase [Chloroflexota bacterium]MDA1282802.1 HAD family phosphatase [Chloroflexota bacterium]